MLLMGAIRGIPAWVVGEFVGTFILVFFGCGSVCAGVTMGAQVGVFQVAIIWGLGIATAIYLTAALSGAHLNPAVTISLAAWGGFPKSRVLGYIATQMVAAFVSAAVLYVIFGGAIAEFENKNDIVRGQTGSEASAMIFGEFYPNPGGKPLSEMNPDRMSQGRAFIAEVIGTAMLLLVIFRTTDPNNKDRPQIMTAATIGLTITLLISLLGPLTMACFNPARDLGPRLFSSMAGWNAVPFTANGTGWFTVYILAPILGGLLGGWIYRVFFERNYKAYKHAIVSCSRTARKCAGAQPPVA
jgi:glycerol uptake facilitator protein